MKTPSLPKLVGILAVMALALANAPAARAEEATPGVQVATIVIPEGLPDATVRDAIVRTAARRLWIVMSQKEGEVVLKLIHRSVEANLTLRYAGTEIQVYSDTYALNKNGERVSAAPLNKGWLQNIRTGILEHLHAGGAPAK